METGKATVGQQMMKLLEKLVDDKPMVSNRESDEPEVTIMQKGDVTKKTAETENKEVVRTLVEKISQDILRRTTLLRNKVTFKEEVEDLGLDQEFGEWPTLDREGEEENFCGESKNWDGVSEESDDEQGSLLDIS